MNCWQDDCLAQSMITMILVGLCFFLSMLITNDVALITFVPFTIVTLKQMGEGMENKHLGEGMENKHLV